MQSYFFSFYRIFLFTMPGLYSSFIQRLLKAQDEKVGSVSHVCHCLVTSKNPKNCRKTWKSNRWLSKPEGSANWMQMYQQISNQKVPTFSSVRFPPLFTSLWAWHLPVLSQTIQKKKAKKEMLGRLTSLNGICIQHRLQSNSQRHLCALLVLHWHLKGLLRCSNLAALVAEEFGFSVKAKQL